MRRVLGYLPQDFGVYPRVSAEDLLDHLAVLKGIGPAKPRREQVQSLLQLTNLFDVRKRAVASFSRRDAAALRHCAGSAGRSAPDHRR